MEPVIGDVAANVDRTIAFICQCVDLNAQIVVLPELVSSGYVFATCEEASAVAETVPDGPSARRWAEVAREKQVYIVAGVPERDGGKLFNTAVLIGPDGFVGKYRKNQLWDREHEFFEPGNLGFPVFSTSLGRIGICICYDAWFPETFRMLALGGADIVCLPTNWVRPAEAFVAPPEAPYSMIHMVLFAAAHSNSIAIAAADRFGTERGVQFEGRSLIVGHTGWPIAGPDSHDREGIIVGDLDLIRAQSDRDWTASNNILGDRRTDLYANLIRSDEFHCSLRTS
jgi:predicted amidohydrolase